MWKSERPATLLGSGAAPPGELRGPARFLLGRGFPAGWAGLPAAGAGRARKRWRWDEPGHGCEPEPERAGAAGGLRARGRREVPDRLVGAGPDRGGSRGRSRAAAGGRAHLCTHTCAAPGRWSGAVPAVCARALPTPPHLSPRPVSPGRTLRPAALGGCAGFCFAAGTSQPPEKAEATPGFLQTRSPRTGLRERLAARRDRSPARRRQTGRSGVGSLLCARRCQQLPFCKETPSCARAQGRGLPVGAAAILLTPHPPPPVTSSARRQLLRLGLHGRWKLVRVPG